MRLNRLLLASALLAFVGCSTRVYQPEPFVPKPPIVVVQPTPTPGPVIVPVVTDPSGAVKEQLFDNVKVGMNKNALIAAIGFPFRIVQNKYYHYRVIRTEDGQISNAEITIVNDVVTDLVIDF